MSSNKSTFSQFGNPNDKNSVWAYFFRSDCKQQAKCNTCQKILSCKGGSTASMLCHLRSVHKIILKSSRPESSVSGGTMEEKKSRITDFFESQTMESMISRMAAKDGFAFSKFTASKDLRELFAAKGFKKLPTCPKSIKEIVMHHAEKLKESYKTHFQNLKENSERFSITFDEWSSGKNRRYMNINLHATNSKFWNLGLVRMIGSLNAAARLALVKDRLSAFGLCLNTDIISICTDGDNVMKKIGKDSPNLHQLCYAHGIQLGVVDILYKKRDLTDVQNLPPELTSDSDENETQEEVTQDLLSSLEIDHDEIVCELSSNSINQLIKKVRKVVKLFKRSPTKNDKLQIYIREEHRKELSVLLDSRTRWNSLLTMLERFMLLKNCILKSLIDLDSEIKITEEEFQQISDIVAALQPVKATVEALCRRDANLITADAALKFMLMTLGEQTSEISSLLHHSLQTRIDERRTEISGVLHYLHFGKRETDPLFPTPTTIRIANFIRDLVVRVQDREEDGPVDLETFSLPDGEADNDENEPATSVNLQLDKAIQNAISSGHTERIAEPKNLLSTIKKEMGLFENGCSRGLHIQLVYNWLKGIPPTSTESERAFSAAGCICTKLRTRLEDNTLDNLCFLRTYFQVNESLAPK